MKLFKNSQIAYELIKSSNSSPFFSSIARCRKTLSCVHLNSIKVVADFCLRKFVKFEIL